MEKITFHYTTPKKNGPVRVRYRLRDGRNIQLCHKSDIQADIADLDKFDADGNTKPRIQIYNQELAVSLKREYDIMIKAYALMNDKGLDKTTEVFEREIAAIKNPIVALRSDTPNIVTRFRENADKSFRAGIIGADRHKHLIVLSNKLERFNIIKGISGITAGEFGPDLLLEFREFITDEYLYVEKYEKLYEKVSAANKPKARLGRNTVSAKMKMLQAFFSDLEDRDEIQKSPFRRMGKDTRRAIMRSQYDEPFFLRKEELLKILKTKVGPNLQGTKDAFLVQCAFGCRVEDFQDMSMDSISVSEEGIPYIHYIPKKGVKKQTDNKEIQTPIVRYAFNIIKRTNFSFPILKKKSEEYGYNDMIKALLQQCKIDRPVAKFNEESKKNDYFPLFKEASSKLARKTNVDLMNKVQIDLYAAGLHKEGSSAVKRYTNLELKDRFALMNLAFGQQPYAVNKELIIKSQ